MTDTYKFLLKELTRAVDRRARALTRNTYSLRAKQHYDYEVRRARRQLEAHLKANAPRPAGTVKLRVIK